ncbi:MAG: hypothetical protein ABI563_04045 [Specibacter sp.]
MSAVREQLLVSAFWSIRRPQAALTAGHFVIRLNDPAMEFSGDSAGDLLHCYHRLVGAMEQLHGPVVAQIYVALNWQPVGDAIGEPVAETSTPTVHVFLQGARLPSVSSILQLPAHDRVPHDGATETDSALREALHSQTGPAAGVAGLPPSPTFSVKELSDVQWTAVLEPRSPTVRSMGVERLLKLAATLESLHARAAPAIAGATLWACEQWTAGGKGAVDGNGAATINLFGRRHGHGENPVADFVLSGALDVPQQPGWA